VTGPAPAGGGKNLGAWFEQNKPLALGGAAAVVVVLALVSRSRGGGEADTTAGATVSPGDSFSAGGQVAGGAYDSTASDLYSSLSPELSSISASLEKLNGTGTPATPVPAAPKVKRADGIYKIAGDDSNKLFKVSNGTIDYISHDEYYAMGNTNKTVRNYVSKDDPMWNSLTWLDASKAAQQKAGKTVTVTPVKKPAAPVKK
jgi:hypothetical protein